MADVTGRERGQLLLLSALGLAALLVVLALVLNTAIYAENTAARESAATEAGDVLRAHHEVRGVVAQAIAAEHDANSSYAAMRENLTHHLATWSNLSARHAAVTSRNTALAVVSLTNGTRIVQDGTRPMTNVDGDSDWTLVTDATSVRTFGLTVERASLVDPTDTSNASELSAAGAFAIAVDDGTGTQRVFVYRDGTDVVVRVADSTGALSADCRAGATTAGVDLVAATVDEAACPPLSGLVAATDPTTVAYRDGGNATGVYTAVVDQPAIDGDLAPAGSASDPAGERIVYAATVEVRYAGPAVTYENRIDVGGAASP